MKRWLKFAGVIALFLSCGLSLHAADLLDQIVATVNGHIILLSDWGDEVRCQALMDGKALDKVTAVDRNTALDHLIDQELLREQIGNTETSATNEVEVSKQLQQIKDLYTNKDNPEAWSQALARYQVTEPQLKNRVALELELMHLMDTRLRPGIEIDFDSIQSYYNQNLLPKLKQSGSNQLTLDLAMPEIREILTQKKMNDLLTAWLQNLRASSEIQKNLPAGARVQ